MAQYEKEEYDRLFLKTKFEREHFSFFFIVVTLAIGLSTFWKFQNYLWNRTPYNIGGWVYSIARYPIETYPTDSYLGGMLSLAILQLIGTIIFTIAIFLFLSVIIADKKGVRSLGITFFLTLVMLMVNFWNLKSIYLSPKGWFKVEITQVSPGIWKFLGISLPGANNPTDRFSFFSNLLTINLLISEITSIFVFVIFAYYSYNNMKQSRARKQMLYVSRGYDLVYIIKQIIFYLIMFAFLIYTVIPVVYTFILSTSNQVDFSKQSLLPSDPVNSFIRNYSSVIFIDNGDRAPSFGSSFMISLFLGFATAIGGLIITLPAAYAIARFRFSGRGTSQFLVLATQMFPGIILLLPQFIFWNQLGLLDKGQLQLNLFFTKLGLYPKVIFGILLAYFVGALAYNVWMMRGYFDTIPRDLEEAALIDGSSTIGAFLKIAIPLAAPGMVAVGIFTFLGAWNEFALAQIFVGESSPAATLPLLFYQYQDTAAPDNPVFFELLSAFSILAALPIVVVFMALQRHLTGGLTQGGVK